jgi:hypothetical protein
VQLALAKIRKGARLLLTLDAKDPKRMQAAAPKETKRRRARRDPPKGGARAATGAEGRHRAAHASAGLAEAGAPRLCAVARCLRRAWPVCVSLWRLGKA